MEAVSKVRTGGDAEPAGKVGNPLPIFLVGTERMAERHDGIRRLSRRGFLAATGTAAVTATVAGLLPGCGGSGGGGTPPAVASTTLWRRSTEGRRASRAAKAHAANRLYATQAAALADPAHPGDDAKVVPLDTTRARYLELFGDGSLVVDLRRI